MILSPEREQEIREKLRLHDLCKFIDDDDYLDYADELKWLLEKIDFLRDQIRQDGCVIEDLLIRLEQKNQCIIEELLLRINQKFSEKAMDSEGE